MCRSAAATPAAREPQPFIEARPALPARVLPWAEVLAERAVLRVQRQTDGLDISTENLGPGFPKGALIVHDGSNSGGASSNLKYVPLE